MFSSHNVPILFYILVAPIPKMGKCTSIHDKVLPTYCYIDLETNSVLFYFKGEWQVGSVRRKAGRSYIIESSFGMVYLNNKRPKYVSQALFAYYLECQKIEYTPRKRMLIG